MKKLLRIRVAIIQAEEILNFWNKCGEEILRILKKQIEKR